MAFNSNTEDTGFFTGSGFAIVAFIFLVYLLFFADGYTCCFNCIRRRLYDPPDLLIAPIIVDIENETAHSD